jgi:hypothetical protein
MGKGTNDDDGRRTMDGSRGEATAVGTNNEWGKERMMTMDGGQWAAGGVPV